MFLLNSCEVMVCYDFDLYTRGGLGWYYSVHTGGVPVR